MIGLVDFLQQLLDECHPQVMLPAQCLHMSSSSVGITCICVVLGRLSIPVACHIASDHDTDGAGM